MKTFDEIIYSNITSQNTGNYEKAIMKEAVKVALQTLCNRIAIGDVTAPKEDIERILEEMEG